MVPAIQRQAQVSFRKVRPELRNEFIEEVIASSFMAYARLFELGKEHLAFPSVLARYAVAQIRAGRRVGSRLRVGDVMSNYSQFRKGFEVQRLDQLDEQEGKWKEILIEDRRAGPAEIAASRIDFANWLRLLPARRRKIALTLASGETTSVVAKKFGVSSARISQLRRWLRESWCAFHGEAEFEQPPRLVLA
jgi:hypothetical protein